MNRFQQPSSLDQAYTIRESETDGPKLVDYCVAGQDLQYTHISSHNIGAIALVDGAGFLKMFVSLIFKKQSGALHYVLVNDSNTEFAPVIASPDLTSHFSLLHPRTGIPDFALKGEILTPEHLKNTGVTEPHIFMNAVPKMMHLGYG